MAAFCRNCGAALGPGVGFCAQCGTRAEVPANPAQAPVVPVQAPTAAAPPKSGGSPVLKIILVLMVIFAVLGVGTAAGLYYVYYRVREKVHEVERSTGFSLPSHTDGDTNRDTGVTKRDSCSLLTQREAATILRVAVTRVEGDVNARGEEVGCSYWTKPVAGDVAARIQAMRGAQEPQSGDGKPSEETKDLMKSMVAALGDVNGGPRPASLTFSVARGDGTTVYNAYRVANSLMPTPGGGGDLTGLGDEAAFGPMDSMLAIRKGNSALLLGLQTLPGGRAKGIAAARVILDRL